MLSGSDLASANAALSSMSQGVRVLSPLVGAGIFTAVGGAWVAVLDTATFGAAIAALISIRVPESPPGEARGSFWRDLSAGYRPIRAVPLLAQLVLVGAVAFSVIGLNETIIFAVIGQGLHRPPTFFGVLTSTQGAASIMASPPPSCCCGSPGRRGRAASRSPASRSARCATGPPRWRWSSPGQ